MEITEKGNQMIIELTQKGKIEVLKYQILKTEDRMEDGRVCIVCFDIPEHVRSVREVFRRFLKKIGFEQVQKSVWQSQKDVCGLMFSLVKHLRIEKWVVVFNAEKILN